jgi:hypothetical protein
MACEILKAARIALGNKHLVCGDWWEKPVCASQHRCPFTGEDIVGISSLVFPKKSIPHIFYTNADKSRFKRAKVLPPCPDFAETVLVTAPKED